MYFSYKAFKKEHCKIKKIKRKKNLKNEKEEIFP